MSDLVQTLRDMVYPCCEEAADEITRLRAALRAVDDEHGYGLPPETRQMIRAALVDKVANRMKRTDECHPRGCATWEEMADEAIDLIRDEVLEEAAKVCEGDFDSEMAGYGDYFAAAIRALKERA